MSNNKQRDIETLARRFLESGLTPETFDHDTNDDNGQNFEGVADAMRRLKNRENPNEYQEEEQEFNI